VFIRRDDRRIVVQPFTGQPTPDGFGPVAYQGRVLRVLGQPERRTWGRRCVHRDLAHWAADPRRFDRAFRSGKSTTD